ncbi:MAG: hypothetical protein SFV21_02515 [Rhodospirillaceae bacterium]|nr:hypothetical protein [Rhodospirillaceae bacterium]
MKRSLSLLAAVSALALSGAFPAAAAEKKTLGFIIIDHSLATHETKYYEECPEGLALGNDELWWKGLSPMDRDKLTNGGLIEPVDPPRRPTAALRGPNYEDVCWNPEIVQDPPLRIVRGPTGRGMNLDGTEDGSATAKSCAHEKFTTPDGTAKVDNQMYRILGCIYGWRKGNYMEGHPNRERRDSSEGIILLEVTDVDDAMNDPDVTVAFHGTSDLLHKKADGTILPWGSYRPVETPHYGTKAKGKIVDGRLITEPVDARLPLFGNNFTGDMRFRDLQIDLNIAPTADGAPNTGMMAGYYDFDSWWDYIRKIEFLTVTGQWSCPAIYVAAKQLADGYPDPETGQCTAISTAMDIEALPVFFIPRASQTAAAGGAP